MESKPRLFIGCSNERLNIALAMQKNLDYYIDVTVWHQGIFEPSKSALESLIKALANYNAAAFLFTPDDAIKINESTEKMTTRDNVIFELGLFMGKLGREKCFIISPREAVMHLPTDLIGMTPVNNLQ